MTDKSDRATVIVGDWYAQLLDQNLAKYRKRIADGHPMTTREITKRIIASAEQMNTEQAPDAGMLNSSWIAATAIQRLLTLPNDRHA